MIVNPNGCPASNGHAETQLETRAVLRRLPVASSGEEAQQLYAAQKAIAAAAHADKHTVISPTHVMMKGDKIVGYLSLGAMPMVHAWFDSKAAKASDSTKMIEHGETAMREQGLKIYTVAVAPDSPFNPHMVRLGFRKLGVTEIWVKQL